MLNCNFLVHLSCYKINRIIPGGFGAVRLSDDECLRSSSSHA